MRDFLDDVLIWLGDFWPPLLAFVVVVIMGVVVIAVSASAPPDPTPQTTPTHCTTSIIPVPCGKGAVCVIPITSCH